MAATKRELTALVTAHGPSSGRMAPERDTRSNPLPGWSLRKYLPPAMPVDVSECHGHGLSINAVKRYIWGACPESSSSGCAPGSQLDNQLGPSSEVLPS